MWANTCLFFVPALHLAAKVQVPPAPQDGSVLPTGSTAKAFRQAAQAETLNLRDPPWVSV
jgi:hypothetical protein